MDLFTYLMAKKGHNTQKDLFSYLLGKGESGGIPTHFEGTNLTINNTLSSRIKNIQLKGQASQNGTPTPETPVSIKVVTGDNLIVVQNKNFFGTIIDQGAINFQGNDGTTNYDIRLRTRNRFFLPKGSYTFSCVQTNIEIVLYYFKAETGDAYNRDTVWNTTLNFTISEDCYIRIMFRKSTNNAISPSDVTNPMIRVSSDTDTTYVPHEKQTYPILLGDLELAKIGDYQDYIYGTPNNWYKYEAISHKEITSSLAYVAISLYTNYSRVQISKGSVGMERGVSVAGVSLCTCFKETNHSSATVGSYNSNNNAYNLQFYLPTTVTTIEEAKTYMDGLTNNIIYYVKATATSTQITDTTLITQLNNLYNNAKTYKDLTNIYTTYGDGNEQMIISLTALIKN